jgi:hypothetical protein
VLVSFLAERPVVPVFAPGSRPGTVVPGDADDSPVVLGVAGHVGGGIRPPLRDPDQARVNKLEALAQPRDLIPGPEADLGVDAAVVQGFEPRGQLRLPLRAVVADDEVASGGKRVAQGGDDGRGLGVIGDEMQHRGQEHGDGLAEVQQELGSGIGENRARLAEVTLDDDGVGVVAQQEPAVGDGDFVVVHVHHAGSGCGGLGDLVDVVLRRDA